MTHRSRFIGLLTVLCLAALVATGCGDAATASDKCAFVIGTGKSGHDANVHKVVYPGQQFDIGEYETARYFPCNSRNYAINNGNVRNGNNDRVGDRFNLSKGYTENRTPIVVAVTAYWTLNQKPEVLKTKFAPLCLKYDCWSKDSESGNANFSTPGWNGMLGENFGTSIDQTMLDVTPQFDDAIWRDHDPEQYKKLAAALSKEFNANAQQVTGYNDDLFCGSGNSGWSDTNKPGEGQFTCTPVRFVVTDVENADNTVQQQASTVSAKDQKIQVNQDQLEIAKAKYGKQAGYWLGLQDTIRGCANAKTSCQLVVGDPSSLPTGK